MKILVCFLVFSLAIAAVFAGYQDDLSPEEALTADDFFEYFEMQTMEKRGDFMAEKRKSKGKVRPCNTPGGTYCQICNLKIKNKNDMRRYVNCGSAHPGI